MASSSGAVPGEHSTSLGRSVSFHRTGSSSRSASIVNVPVEHLQTVQSGIQADWPPIQPPWITRNDSAKAFYEGSVATVPFKHRVKRGVGLSDSRKPDVWKAAGVELVATAGLTFLSITVYLQAGSEASAAFLQALIYSVAILAAAPVSGGHLNPAVTFTTFLTGHATLIRSALYVVAQLLGGVIGAAGVRLLTSAEARTSHSIGGCAFAGSSALSNMQGLFAEMVFTIIMLFVVYGIGFDKRSVVVTFPILAPFIIGGVLGVLVFVSQGLGYTAAMNPARCFGPAVVYGRNLWDPLYAFFIGPLVAALVVGVFQIFVHQAHGAGSGPVLPLNFFQAVTRDHRRRSFGRATPAYNTCPTGDVIAHPQAAPDHEVSHSQHDLVAHSSPAPFCSPAMTPGVLQLPSEPGCSKFSLTLQIKAFMQPTGFESNQVGSAVSIADVTRPADQDLALLQQSSSPSSPGGAPPRQFGAGDPDKDR